MGCWEATVLTPLHHSCLQKSYELGPGPTAPGDMDSPDGSVHSDMVCTYILPFNRFGRF